MLTDYNVCSSEWSRKENIQESQKGDNEAYVQIGWWVFLLRKPCCVKIKSKLPRSVAMIYFFLISRKIQNCAWKVEDVKKW